MSRRREGPQPDMTPRTTLAVCGACAAVAVPSTALAAGPLAAPAPLGEHDSVVAALRSDAHARAERRTLRVARTTHKRITPGYVDRLDAMTVRALARERARLRAAAKDRKAARAAPPGARTPRRPSSRPSPRASRAATRPRTPATASTASTSSPSRPGRPSAARATRPPLPRPSRIAARRCSSRARARASGRSAAADARRWAVCCTTIRQQTAHPRCARRITRLWMPPRCAPSSRASPTGPT